MIKLLISELVVACFRCLIGVNETSGVDIVAEFLVIKSHINLKAELLTLPLKNLYKSPSLLQISVIPDLAFDLKSTWP